MLSLQYLNIYDKKLKYPKLLLYSEGLVALTTNMTKNIKYLIHTFKNTEQNMSLK